MKSVCQGLWLAVGQVPDLVVDVDPFEGVVGSPGSPLRPLPPVLALAVGPLLAPLPPGLLHALLALALPSPVSTSPPLSAIIPLALQLLRLLRRHLEDVEGGVRVGRWCRHAWRVVDRQLRRGDGQETHAGLVAAHVVGLARRTLLQLSSSRPREFLVSGGLLLAGQHLESGHESEVVQLTVVAEPPLRDLDCQAAQQADLLIERLGLVSGLGRRLCRLCGPLATLLLRGVLARLALLLCCTVEGDGKPLAE